MTVLRLLAVLTSITGGVWGHGYLLDPPSRSSMWKAGYSVPANYNHMGLNCGGSGFQWSKDIGGRCGICGDKWTDSPRPNEAGGVYARGIITRHYQEGQEISVKVEVTAHHKGWFEFRACPNNDVTTAATQECLDRYLLPLADGSGTRWELTPGNGQKTVNLKLPEGLTCDQCVVQWKWNTGNSWGTDPDGTSCIGCGKQEQFYGCADVSIAPRSDGAGEVTTPSSSSSTPASTSTRPSTSASSSRSTASPTPASSSTPASSRSGPSSSQALGASSTSRPAPSSSTATPSTTRQAPSSTSATSSTSRPAPSSSTATPTTSTSSPPSTPSSSRSTRSLSTTHREERRTPPQEGSTHCWAVGIWTGDRSKDEWCVNNCNAGFCPAEYCRCEGDPTPTPTSPQAVKVCKSNGVFKGRPTIDAWCEENCHHNPPYCPSSHCKCELVQVEPSTPRRTRPSQRSTTSPGTTPRTSSMPSGSGPGSGDVDEGPEGKSASTDSWSEERLKNTDSCTTYVATGEFTGDKGMNAYCQTSCSFGQCSERHCACADEEGYHGMRCYPQAAYAVVPNFDDYCKSACSSGMCPGCVCWTP